MEDGTRRTSERGPRRSEGGPRKVRGGSEAASRGDHGRVSEVATLVNLVSEVGVSQNATWCWCGVVEGDHNQPFDQPLPTSVEEVVHKKPPLLLGFNNLPTFPTFLTEFYPKTSFTLVGPFPKRREEFYRYFLFRLERLEGWKNLININIS